MASYWLFEITKKENQKGILGFKYVCEDTPPPRVFYRCFGGIGGLVLLTHNTWFIRYSHLNLQKKLSKYPLSWSTETSFTYRLQATWHSFARILEHFCWCPDTLPRNVLTSDWLASIQGCYGVLDNRKFWSHAISISLNLSHSNLHLNLLIFFTIPSCGC